MSWANIGPIMAFWGAKRSVLAGRWQERRDIKYQDMFGALLTGVISVNFCSNLQGTIISKMVAVFLIASGPRSVAAGSEGFVERTKDELGIRAKGRKVLGSGEAFQLREPGICYRGIFGSKNDDIGTESSYFWNINLCILTR